MKRREGKAAPPTDLLVCFPSRAHLTLMPKQICSPLRATESLKRHNHHFPRHPSRSSNNNKGGGQGSPLLWAKSKANMGGGGGGSEFDEPTSPKVTCAGQIKVRPKSGSSCKNWQSVMDEIERIHKKNRSSSSRNKKKPTWVEALGFKKDVVQFLTCLRGFRFDLRCFGNFHGSGVISDDEEDDNEDGEQEEEERENDEVGHGERIYDDDDDDGSSKTVFSKWFMVLQENQNNGNEEGNKKDVDDVNYPSAPPTNALLLMRCRSAPAKSWLEEKEEEKQKQKEEEELEESKNKLKLLLEEEKKKKEESNLIVKCYSPDFFKVSSDVAKETWIVGGMRDPLSRSRSWKK